MKDLVNDMRQFGPRKLPILKQSLEDLGITRDENGTVIRPRQSDKAFPVRKIRRALSSFGWRGDALRKELDRIVAGPDARDAEPGIMVVYPYGWEKKALTREMRRMFPQNSGKRQLLMIDELHLWMSRRMTR
ncbi:hypothetical protein AZH90_004369 [Salmonella enterica subsp. enterica serovar Legon]|nr:hypothetical protein [Salmonella enterica subsp. enterica serovar Weybridge]EDS6807097.1 hypothetical protein [Salmonella enterica subsp. enterica serovar Legon]EDW9825513.1 hypothetical protein [Salmonella enterica]EHL5833772.1 hypothetical protein [Salmonella enterica]